MNKTLPLDYSNKAHVAKRVAAYKENQKGLNL